MSGSVAWKLPAHEALRRVDELRESSIFPPQVTCAAHEMSARGRLVCPALPTTVEEGRRAFEGLRFLENPEASREREPEEETVIRFCDVSSAYRSVKGEPKVIFDGLSLDIRRGEKIALIGSNGAGKSTLMKLMTGLIRPVSGDILMNGESILKKKTEDLSKDISLVYQNPEEMFIKDTIEADIAYAMKVRNVKNQAERTQEMLERFRLTPWKNRDGRLLSGGQMRRASLAIGIALNPGILLLDEPTANLDIATRREIMRTLADIRDVTETVLIATHDMQLVCEWAERIVVLFQGHVIADGSRNEIFGNGEIVRRAGIRPPEIFQMGRSLDQRALCYTIQEFMQSFEEADL